MIKFSYNPSNLKGENMPFVNVKVAAPEPSKEQKRQIIAEMTDTLVRVLGKDPAAVLVMIETLEAESIGKSGLSLEDLRSKK
ncbi:tautomerase family protein [Campylobacter sp.]|uniref:tautomerase family protein n=1 Tax=Campylobacter sp. TaxID=205 RepID=UPI00403EAB13